MPVNTLLLLIVITLSIYLCVAMVAPEKFQE
ncbi:potassium-transporting ATPase subunit F [Cellvibrio mixtus]